MSRTKRLTAFTQSYSQAAVIFPFILVAPAYFAGKIQLGGLMQTAEAFGNVQKALSFFVSVYRTIAEWRAVIARLDGFEMSIAERRAAKTARDSIVLVATGAATTIDLDKLLVQLPNGAPQVAADGFRIRAHRTHAGDGSVRRRQVDAVPRDRRHLAVRQRPIAVPAKAIADDAAATAVFPDRHAAGRDRLSERSRAHSAPTRSGRC